MNSVMCQEKKKFCKNFISQPVEARIFGPNISFFLHSSNFWLQYCQKSLNLCWENIGKISGKCQGIGSILNVFTCLLSFDGHITISFDLFVIYVLKRCFLYFWTGF